MRDVDARDSSMAEEFLGKPEERHCDNESCGVKMSKLNKGKLCFACQRKADLELYRVTARNYRRNGLAKNG